MTDSSMIATQLFDPRTGTACDADATRLLVMPDDPVEGFEEDPTFPDVVIPPAPQVAPTISPKTWWLIAVATALVLTLLLGATKAALANPSSIPTAPLLQPTVPLVVAAPPPEPPQAVVLPAGDGAPGVTPRQAADAYLAGRWCEARPLYDALASQHPDDPTYPAIVRVLRRSCPE